MASKVTGTKRLAIADLVGKPCMLCSKPFELDQYVMEFNARRGPYRKPVGLLCLPCIKDMAELAEMEGIRPSPSQPYQPWPLGGSSIC